jgi:8-oxo-dGTP diphosphatase
LIVVVAALIESGGRYLVGQRKKGDRHALKWEFPGGKVEHGESPRRALERELKEELGISAVIDEEVIRYEYSYGGKPPIMLIFKRVRRWQGEPCCHAFEEIRWVTPQEMPGFDFLDGDIDFVRRLSRGEI